MTEESKAQREIAVPFSLSLFPRHIKMILDFADESGRSKSNAAQFIFEDWVRLKRAAIEDAAVETDADANGVRS